MLVCHIAGCARVLNSTTGIPAPGEAGCDTHCSTLVHPYIATVHRYLAAYAAPNAPAGTDLTGLPDPAPFTAASSRLHRRRPHQPWLPHPRHPLCPDPDHRRFRVPRRTGHPLRHLLGPPSSEPAQ